jgi:hypothetical protein
LIRIAAPIAAPKKIAPIQNGLTSSTAAMPSIVSQIAGLQSRQSPLTTAAYLASPHAHLELSRDALLDRGDGAERLSEIAARQPGERRRVDEVVGLLAGA